MKTLKVGRELLCCFTSVVILFGELFDARFSDTIPNLLQRHSKLD